MRTLADAPGDCPECRSAGSVEHGVCQVCFAELEEGAPVAEPGPSLGLRFADVIAELEAVAGLAGPAAGRDVIEACQRARLLLHALREQFLEQVVLAAPGEPPVPGATPVAI